MDHVNESLRKKSSDNVKIFFSFKVQVEFGLDLLRSQFDTVITDTSRRRANSSCDILCARRKPLSLSPNLKCMTYATVCSTICQER